MSLSSYVTFKKERKRQGVPSQINARGVLVVCEGRRPRAHPIGQRDNSKGFPFGPRTAAPARGREDVELAETWLRLSPYRRCECRAASAGRRQVVLSMARKDSRASISILLPKQQNKHKVSVLQSEDGAGPREGRDDPARHEETGQGVAVTGQKHHVADYAGAGNGGEDHVRQEDDEHDQVRAAQRPTAALVPGEPRDLQRNEGHVSGGVTGAGLSDADAAVQNHARRCTQISGDRNAQGPTNHGRTCRKNLYRAR